LTDWGFVIIECNCTTVIIIHVRDEEDRQRIVLGRLGRALQVLEILEFFQNGMYRLAAWGLPPGASVIKC